MTVNPHLPELSRTEAFELLGETGLGRIAFLEVVGVLPVILPVNYVLHAGAVTFQTEPGSTLSAALRDAPVAFEADGTDSADQTGWSVIIRGHAEELTDPNQLAALARRQLQPWTTGPDRHYVQIRPSLITGRRISLIDPVCRWWG